MTRALRPLAATALIFVLAYAAAALQYPSLLSTRVLGDLLTDNAFLGITAVGMTFVILSGGIDLSICAVIGFTGVLLAALIFLGGVHPLVAFAVALAVAVAVGATMGCIIHYLEVPSFIMTLAGMFFARGAASILTQESIPILHPFYHEISALFVKLPGGGRITAIGALMLLVFEVGTLLAHRTRFGSNVYAIGRNPTSASLMGCRSAEPRS